MNCISQLMVIGPRDKISQKHVYFAGTEYFSFGKPSDSRVVTKVVSTYFNVKLS